MKKEGDIRDTNLTERPNFDGQKVIKADIDQPKAVGPKESELWKVVLATHDVMEYGRK